MRDTRISWAHHTFNPWWGCTEVSAGCDNCYARTLAGRFGVGWGHHAARRKASPRQFAEVRRWDRAAAVAGVRERVFCLSMGDWADAEVPDEWRAEMFALIRETEHLDWLLLTKRPNLIGKLVPWGPDDEAWPNVWLGTSVESQAQMWRLAALGDVPAVIHFVSAEPLLGPLNLQLHRIGLHCVDWVIVGAESGAKRRRFENGWALDIKRQCVAADVPVWMKQGPGLRPGVPFGDVELDGVHELPGVGRG